MNTISDQLVPATRNAELGIVYEIGGTVLEQGRCGPDIICLHRPASWTKTSPINRQ
jgi:hypothetical protein